jgi:hypothetical protein
MAGFTPLGLARNGEYFHLQSRWRLLYGNNLRVSGFRQAVTDGDGALRLQFLTMQNSE